MFTLCGDTMFAHFVVPILQRGAHFNLKILNDNCSSVVKCKCTFTECECPIDSIKSNSDRQLYIKTKKKDVFIFFRILCCQFDQWKTIAHSHFAEPHLE